MWWYLPIIPALERMRQEDQEASLNYIVEFKISLEYTITPCFRKEKKKRIEPEVLAESSI